MTRARIWAGLAGLGLAMSGVGAAQAATVTFEGVSTGGDDVTIAISTDDDNLGANRPTFLSFFDLAVEVGGESYTIDQTYFRLNGWGDRITSGTANGTELSFVAEEGFLSPFLRPGGTDLLTNISLTFAQTFPSPLTIDSLFGYLGSAQLIGANGASEDGFAFELAPPNAVPLPAAAFLFLGGLGALVGRRVVELGGIEPPTS